MKRLVLTLIVTSAAIIGAAAQAARPSVSILGDSYSTFEGYLTPDTMETWYLKGNGQRRTDVTAVSQTWWWQVIKRMGWKLEVNNSWSGSTICNTGYNDEDRTYKSFITRMGSLGSPDVVLVFGATNDSWANSPLGQTIYEGWRLADLFCFRPAMSFMLHSLLERHPTADIYFILNTELKESINRSVDEICAHYGVKVIHLRDIDKQSGHPNVKGMAQIADQVVSAIKESATK